MRNIDEKIINTTIQTAADYAASNGIPIKEIHVFWEQVTIDPGIDKMTIEGLLKLIKPNIKITFADKC